MYRYTLVNENNYVVFEKIISKMLEDGWNCQGGVAVHINDGYVYYTQAMVTAWKTERTANSYR